jgi:AraC family transcriptional regulator of arabinose operon
MEPRIYKAILLMTYDLNREIPLDALARSVNLSTSRLRHLFKDETGLSPAQYVKAQRLLRAKYLLETTFLNLKEIMHKSGLRDRSHFTRDFSKAYGLPPLQYRKHHLEGKQMKSSPLIARSATR